jgi:hypothetical protein
VGAARTLIARTVVAFAIAVPWLAFAQPAHVLPRALLVTLLLAAAFHGWGSGLATLVRRDVRPTIAVAWGIAVVAAFLGAAMAASLRVQLPVLIVGLVLNAALLGVRFHSAVSSVEAALRSDGLRWWIAPAVLVIAIGSLHVLGAAGSVALRPFDDDGHVVAQVRRLLDTGTLADPIGYARATQLGASVAFDALAAVFHDLAFVRVTDALGFVLVLVLVCRAIDVRDAATSVWAGVVVVTLGFIAVAWPDPSPLWLPIALALALAQTADEPAGEPATLIPVGLLAGALIALRLEWMPFAVVLAAAAWKPREPAPSRLVRGVVLLAAVFVVVIPYLFVRLAAWARTSDAVAKLVVHRKLGVAVLVSAAILIAAVAVTRFVVARVAQPIVRWTAIAVVASLGCVVGSLTATAPYGAKYAWPIVVAGALIVVIETARRGDARISGLAMVLATAAVLLGYEARLAHSHERLTVHYAELLANIELARTAHAGEPTDPDYAHLLELTSDAAVGVWVVRPEQIAYTRHPIIDLRVPRLAQGRARPWQADHADSVLRVLRATKLHYLLIEDDGAGQRYAEENPVAALLCGDHCRDPLERMLATQRLVGRAGATRLYELRW